MKVRFFTFEQFHNKKNVGSTRLRVHNLIKYWEEADLYKYGENPDVLVFQKVYCLPDYKFPAHFENLKILDICDPDWLDNAYVKETCDAMDAIVCPTDRLAEFLKNITDTPIKVIPDRHITDGVKFTKEHKGDIKKVVWFGYKHNIETLKQAIPFIERMNYQLTVISEEDPVVDRWGKPDFKDRVTFLKFDKDTLYEELGKHDLAILPYGSRPRDRFKSNNRAAICWLSGIPVAYTIEDVEHFNDPKVRQKAAEDNFDFAMENYDARKSVVEYKELIEELNANASKKRIKK